MMRRCKTLRTRLVYPARYRNKKGCQIDRADRSESNQRRPFKPQPFRICQKEMQGKQDRAVYPEYRFYCLTDALRRAKAKRSVRKDLRCCIYEIDGKHGNNNSADILKHRLIQQKSRCRTSRRYSRQFPLKARFFLSKPHS